MYGLGPDRRQLRPALPDACVTDACQHGSLQRPVSRPCRRPRAAPAATVVNWPNWRLASGLWFLALTQLAAGVSAYTNRSNDTTTSNIMDGVLNVDSCLTFYEHDPEIPGIVCPAACPLRTQCLGDSGRSSCIYPQDCQWLLRDPQAATMNWMLKSGANFSEQVCISCSQSRDSALAGCGVCGTGQDGVFACVECKENYRMTADGTCEWVHLTKAAVCVIGFTLFVLVTVGWTIFEFVTTECHDTSNSYSLERGLIMRRRAQLFHPVQADFGDKKLERYPLHTDLHGFTGPNSASVMGPGLPLFMNWFCFVVSLALLFTGAIWLYGPSSTEESVLLDPCMQQDRPGFDFRTARPQIQREPDGIELKWAAMNYFGAVGLSVLFLYWQEYVWGNCVHHSMYPSLREYCVVLRGMPKKMTDKDAIRRDLGDWLEKIRLDRNGIRDISIAYNIPVRKQRLVNNMIERHIHSVATKHFEDMSGLSLSPTHSPTRNGDKMVRTVASLHHSGGLMRAGSTIKPEAEVEGATPLMPVTRLLSSAFFQTPIWETRTDRARVKPIEVEDAELHKCRHLLKDIPGSGYVFIVMETEAMACAVAGMGCVRLETISPGKPIRVSKASAEPPLIRWDEYGYKPLEFRWPCSVTGTLVSRSIAPVIPFVCLWLWLLLFSAFLQWELDTKGGMGGRSNMGWIKDLIGLFVGMLVPIGNAVLGLSVEIATNIFGFQDFDNARLWRHILNFIINACANVGEIYLVIQKVQGTPQWTWGDAVNMVRDGPIGVSPATKLFQEELMAILFPAGLLVPIITIPFLSDLLPAIVGRLRVKCDSSLTPDVAERVMKPGYVDPIGPYTDFVINLFMITFASWISPGRYLIVLWCTFAAWAILLYANMRLNVLRWQARTWFGSNKLHRFEAFLLAFPLSFLAAALDHQLTGGSGASSAMIHFGLHSVVVFFALERMESRRESYGTNLEDMMRSDDAPLANYRNTNPIEVLKETLQVEDADEEPLVFYRDDKWYLQHKGYANMEGFFAGEEDLAIESCFKSVRQEARQFGVDLFDMLVDMARETFRGSAWAGGQLVRTGSSVFSATRSGHSQHDEEQPPCEGTTPVVSFHDMKESRTYRTQDTKDSRNSRESRRSTSSRESKRSQSSCGSNGSNDSNNSVPRIGLFAHDSLSSLDSDPKLFETRESKPIIGLFAHDSQVTVTAFTRGWTGQSKHCEKDCQPPSSKPARPAGCSHDDLVCEVVG